VPFYIERTIPCGAADCVAEIILLGTPLLWWSFLPALGATLWFGVARRDWRAGAILVMTAFAIVPWFFFSSRTMFYFYALPAEPFLILAVVFALGMFASAPRAASTRLSRPAASTRSKSSLTAFRSRKSRTVTIFFPRVSTIASRPC
jgi:dolichyl-phosphate-mannose--protein O-mannosyl transferase